MNIKKYIIISLLAFLMSCYSSERDYSKVVSEMVGQTISFPDSIKTFDSTFTKLPATDFTILAYYDSEGCTSCRMKMSKWNSFMQIVDSVRNDVTVNLILITETEKPNEVEIIARQNDFHHLIATVSDKLFAELNHIPSQEKLQCFLLDRNNQIVLIGNPLENQAIQKLYLTEIAGAEIETDGWKTYSFDFGEINKNQEVSHIFKIVNSCKDSIQVMGLESSCECTQGNISQRLIAPNEAYEVGVTFKDTIQGHFSRTVMVLFDHHPDILFEITGEIR